MLRSIALSAALVAVSPNPSVAQGVAPTGDYPAWAEAVDAMMAAKTMDALGPAIESACREQHEMVAVLGLTIPFGKIRCAAARGAKLLVVDKQASFVRAALLLDSMWDTASSMSGWGATLKPNDQLAEFQADLLEIVRGLVRDPRRTINFLVAAERKETLAWVDAFVPRGPGSPGAREMIAVLADPRTRTTQAQLILELACKLGYEEVAIAGASLPNNLDRRIAAARQAACLPPSSRGRFLQSVLATKELWSNEVWAFSFRPMPYETFEAAMAKLIQNHLGQPTTKPNLKNADERAQWLQQIQAKERSK